MAIEITVAELAAANRIGSTTQETTEVTRIRDYAVVAISQHLTVAVYDAAPVEVLDMAASLLLGYLYDKPTVSGGVSLANALKFSGAARVLFPYRLHTVGMVGGDAVVAAQAAVGTVGNPVTDVDIVGTELRITFSDGTTEMLDLPAAGGGTVDQDARDSAASAQTAADGAQTDIDEHEANHPSGGTGVDQTARDSAAAAATAAGDAQTTADTNTTALTSRLQRGDVSPGTGIEITPTEGSTTGLTISAVETTSGPTVLTGAWSWITFSPNAGEVMPSDTVVPPAIDTWIFNTTGATYDDDRAALLALASGATILFYQTDDRQQTVTLTETPTLSGSTVTVTGSGSRTGGFGELGPANFGTLTITLTPGSVETIDEQARTAAATAQTTADGAATAAAGAQGTADGAATSAAAAQTTANTGIANAANAQSTADGAATSAGAAQTTADGKIDADAANALIAAHTHQPDATRYAASLALLTDIAAGDWASYTSGLDAGELFKNGAFTVVTAAGRDKLVAPVDGVYVVKGNIAGNIDLGNSTHRGWLATRLIRTRGGVETAMAPEGTTGYARNQLGAAAQYMSSAVDGFFELQANDQIHLEGRFTSQSATNLFDLTSGYLGLVKF